MKRISIACLILMVLSSSIPKDEIIFTGNSETICTFANDSINKNTTQVKHDLKKDDLQVIFSDTTFLNHQKIQALKEYYKAHPDTAISILQKHNNILFKMPIAKIPDKWQSNMPVMVPDSTVNFTLKIVPPQNK